MKSFKENCEDIKTNSGQTECQINNNVGIDRKIPILTIYLAHLTIANSLFISSSLVVFEDLMGRLINDVSLVFYCMVRNIPEIFAECPLSVTMFGASRKHLGKM